jgi:prepilin-type N-terminal cleavage/methylation domain-containing protein
MSAVLKTQRGFTLVELSIVLVIIGLIIGGVLTGQQIIQNARITNAQNGIQAYEAQFQTYVQNYGALPGDDPIANTRFSNSVTPGNGNGTIDGTFDAGSTSGQETTLAWADLRAASLVKNQLPTTAQPSNPFNGIYGFQGSAFSGNANTPFTTSVLCLSDVPGAAALALDSRLDDGVSNSGNIQAVLAGQSALTGTPPVSYDSAQTYTICIKM